MGFPRFKSRRRHALSVRFTTGTIRVEDDRRHVTLPRLGTLKTHESTRKLARRIADSRARILSATVRAEAGRWFVAFTVEVQRTRRAPCHPDAVVGVDLGVKTLAVFSDGRPPAENPRHCDAAKRKLARLSRAVSRRQGPDRRTGQRPSNRWRKSNAARNRVHHRTANLRQDAIHQLTTALAREYGTVVVEDLNRWYPSSKTCSGCGVVKPELRLSERVFACTTCGLALGRDANAAVNLASLIEHVDVAGSGPETQNGRRADRKDPTHSGWLR